MAVRSDDIAWVEFEEKPVPAKSPHRIVFSTRPQFARAADGFWYFLKGPSPEVAFPEAAAYRLADLVGLSVPPWALGRVSGSDRIYFASRRMLWRSDVDAVLELPGIVNPELLAEVVAFDVWIANVDRNINNVVADSAGADAVRLFAIDFEKSELLRGKGQIELAALDDDRCWPREDLAPFIRRQAPPVDCVSRIVAISEAQLHAALAPLLLVAPAPARFDLQTATHALLGRAKQLNRLLTKEVWHGKDH